MHLMKLLSKNDKHLKCIGAMAIDDMSEVGLWLWNFFGFLAIARASLVVGRNFYEADYCLNFPLI